MGRTLSTGCAGCASGDCWYCERSTGTRLTADSQELPVCCCRRVFITSEGWIAGARPMSITGGEGTRHYAIHEIDEHAVSIVAIPTARGDNGSVVATYKAPDQDDVDALLRLNGRHKVSGWMDCDDVPSGARRAMVSTGGDRS